MSDVPVTANWAVERAKASWAEESTVHDQLPSEPAADPAPHTFEASAFPSGPPASVLPDWGADVPSEEPPFGLENELPKELLPLAVPDSTFPPFSLSDGTVDDRSDRLSFNLRGDTMSSKTDAWDVPPEVATWDPSKDVGHAISTRADDRYIGASWRASLEKEEDAQDAWAAQARSSSPHREIVGGDDYLMRLHTRLSLIEVYRTTQFLLPWRRKQGHLRRIPSLIQKQTSSQRLVLHWRLPPF
jgi:hypothetical protein